MGYDLQSRLGTVSLGGVSATYQYQPGGTTVTGVNRPLSAVVGAPAGVMEGSLSRDVAGRVRTAHWQRRGTIRGTEVYGSVTYQYDAAGRRRQATDFANVSWHYGYNKRGEVTGAEKRAASGTVLGSWGQGYSYDDIGNRRQVVTPEGETLAMSANALNQISTRQTEQKSWLRGRAHPLASVVVDGNALTREGRNWKFLLNAAGSGSELRIQEYIVQAARADLVPEVGDAIDETVTFRPSSVSLTHDDDGNLTFDGRWHYEWDAENRLVGMEEAASHSISGTGVSSGFARANRLEFAYDALGRRVRKRVLDAPRDAQGVRSGAWVLKKETVFVWQDWRLLAEYVKTPEITTLQLRRSYLWGMDLVSGVYQAGMAENATALNPAGGVGGLLWVVDYLPGQSTSQRQLAPWYDGNGNILGWVENELAQVQPLHRLEYDGFGRLLVDDPVRVALTNKQRDLGATEAWLDRPAFGFSTKYEDGETGLLYYGHRYYAPEVGRWPSRDPIGERGGINLYGMVGNDAVNNVDVLGLDRWIMGSFHTRLFIDEYDEMGNKTGCATQIDFGPKLDSGRNGGQLLLYVGAKRALRGAGQRGAWGAALSLALLEGKIYITPNQPLPIERGRVIRASKDQDRQLLMLIEELDKDVLEYNTVFFNCRHFVRTVANYPMQDIPGFTLGPVPFMPGNSARPDRQEGKYVIFVDDAGNEYPVWGTMPPTEPFVPFWPDGPPEPWNPKVSP